MKRKLALFSRRYASALRKHLKQGLLSSLQPAYKLGQQAVKLELVLLDVAQTHHGALTLLDSSEKENERATRAEKFLLATLKPMTNLWRTGWQSIAQSKPLSANSNRRSVRLAASNRRLQSSILRRNSKRVALVESGRHSLVLLKVSHQLQARLRKLAHKSISAQEQERKTFSHQLQDDILQCLLCVQIGLLDLKANAHGDTANLTKQIANIQRLVQLSSDSVDRFTHELDTRQQA